MDFFKKIRLRLFFSKTPNIFLASFYLLLSIAFIVNNLNKGFKLSPDSLILLPISIVLLLILIHVLREDNEYRELMRQAKLHGGVESTGELLTRLPSNPKAYGILKFNNDILFYSHHEIAKIVNPKKITEISYHSGKGLRGGTFYYVVIRYEPDNGFMIESHNMMAAKELCKELKTTLAPHLLDD